MTEKIDIKMFVRLGLLLIALSYFVDCQLTYSAYDCRRPGTLCQGGCTTTGASAGVCICAAGRTGYDCSLAGTAVTNLANCNNIDCNTTGSNAICYTPAGGSNQQCYCAPEFVSNAVPCTTPRVRTTCTASTMGVIVDPIPGSAFQGKLFVKGFRAAPACNFPAPAAPSTTFAQTITLGQCGAVGRIDVSNMVTRYEVVVVVQYNQLIETISDEEHTIVCNHYTDGRISGSVGVEAATSRLGVNVTGNFSVSASMEIRRASDNSDVTGAGPVVVGDALNINVILGSPLYDDLRVTQCSVYDSPQGTIPRNEKVLVVNSCPDIDALNVVRSPLTKNVKTVTLPVDAVKFETSDRLYFECSVLVCATVGEAKCAVQTCNGLANGFGRRKRGAEEPDSKVAGSFKVISRLGTELEISCPVPTHTVEPCMQSTPFLAVTSVFGLLLLVALCISIFVCFRHTRSDRTKPDGNVPASYFNKGMSKA